MESIIFPSRFRTPIPCDLCVTLVSVVALNLYRRRMVTMSTTNHNGHKERMSRCGTSFSPLQKQNIVMFERHPHLKEIISIYL